MPLKNTHMMRCAWSPPADGQVRLEFLRVVGDWMLHLRERADHEGRLLPYVLAALVDEAPQVRGKRNRLRAAKRGSHVSVASVH
jgi:hypothetical protein